MTEPIPDDCLPPEHILDAILRFQGGIWDGMTVDEVLAEAERFKQLLPGKREREHHRVTLRRRIYVAGPYTHDPVACTQRAIAVGARLLDLGYAPFVPHLSHYWHVQSRRPYEDWLAIDLAWVTCAEAVVRLPGPSAGADRETDLARRLGIPVFESIEALVKSLPANRTS